MAKIQIKQLPINQSELKELGDRETTKIIGGDSKISSDEMIQIAMQNALNRIDNSLHSNVTYKPSAKI
jgi:hypothetical protein